VKAITRNSDNHVEIEGGGDYMTWGDLVRAAEMAGVKPETKINWIDCGAASWGGVVVHVDGDGLTVSG
jgi:hypothetical protein